MQPQPISRFTLSLLGRFDLASPQSVVHLPSKKVACVLAFLACAAPRMQPRERLAELLWGSGFDIQAKQNLRQSLFRLRSVLGSDAITGDGEYVGLASGVVNCDVARFEQLVAEGTYHSLKAAADLYRGPLLEGLVVTEESWNAWLSHERDRLQDIAVGVLVALGHYERTAGRHDLAVNAGQRAVALNALREDAHRLIIAGLAAAGRKAEALKHHLDLVALLRRELDVEPDSDTLALIQALRSLDSHGGISPPKPEQGAIVKPSDVPIDARPASEPSLQPRQQTTYSAVQSTPPTASSLSLIVLPFTAFNDNKEHAYIADAMTEVVTSDLSRIPTLTVIASTTAATFDATNTDIKQMCRVVGARFVLQGSIQCNGNVIRITAQLLDGTSGVRLWSDRFDGDGHDPFALQDQITGRIAISIGRKIDTVAAADIERRKSSPIATERLLRGIAAEHLRYSSESLKLQESHFREAMRLDPLNGDAHARFARSVILQLFSHFVTSPAERASMHADAREAAARAMTLDPNNHNAHIAMGLLHIHQRMFAQAIIDNETAVSLDRNSWRGYNNLGIALTHDGQPEKAILAIERAIRLDPLGPQIAINHLGIGFAKLQLGEIEAAHLSFLRARAANRALPRAWTGLAVTLVLKGDVEGARVVAGELAKAAPAYRLSQSIDAVFPASPEPYKQFFEKTLAPSAATAGVPI